MNTINLDAESKRVHDNAVNKGFWEPNNKDTHIIFYLKQIAMIHSECTEVAEALRKSEGEKKVVGELADIIIRTLDLYWGLKEDGYTDVSLHDAYLEKTKFNEQRERMHGVLA